MTDVIGTTKVYAARRADGGARIWAGQLPDPKKTPEEPVEAQTGGDEEETP